MVAALARGRGARGERLKKRMLYRHLKCTSAHKDPGFTTAQPVRRPVRRCKCRNLRRNEERMLGWATQQAYTHFAQITNALSKLHVRDYTLSISPTLRRTFRRDLFTSKF